MIRAWLIALSVVITACESPAVAPSASPSAIAAVAASPTTVPPTASPSPTETRHMNAVLGYAVTFPPPWRVSECLSGLATDAGARIGNDTLTWRTAAQERDDGAGGDTGPSGSLTWVITITGEISPQTPTEFATARGARSFASTTIDGKAALQVTDAFGRGWPAYYIATAGRMYTIYLSADSHVPQPFTAIEAIFDAIARSVTFVTPAARPTPTLAPQLSADATTLVDAVAAAFAASDADRLRELMAPKCWFGAGYYQSSGSALSREKMAEGLRSSFARGLKVSVESRPIRTDATIVRGPFWVWATWSAYGDPVIRADDVQLVFGQQDGGWYWIGALFHAGALRR